MKASNWKKFKLLMWKNLLIQWRHKERTIFELLFPLVATAAVLLSRYISGPGSIEGPIYYKGLDTLQLDYDLVNEMEIELHALAYSPYNPVLDQFIRNASSLIKFRERGFVEQIFSNSSARDLEKFLKERDVFAGLEFPDSFAGITELPDALSVNIRFPWQPRFYRHAGSSWELNMKFANVSIEGPRNPNSNDGGSPVGYYREGFIAVQSALSKAFIENKTGRQVTPNLHLQRYPYPKYRKDFLWVGLDLIIPLLIILTLAWPAVNLVKYMILEKEQRQKDAMVIMGLSNWLHWSSWFTKAFLEFAIITVLMTIILKVDL